MPVEELRAPLAGTIAFSCVDGPGNRFVVFFQGCNFDCLACHNPHTIPPHVPHAREATVAELVEEIRGPAPFIRGVTVSGGEATLHAPFVRELFTAIKADPSLGRLTTLVDSNGSCGPEVWDALAPVMDGVMIDLKCLDPVVHLAMTAQPNDAVLRSIVHLHAIRRLEEVRLLIAPGHNDSPDVLEATARWLAAVDASMRVKVIGFRRHGARAGAQHWDEATPADLDRVASVLRDHGIDEILLV